MWVAIFTVFLLGMAHASPLGILDAITGKDGGHPTGLLGFFSRIFNKIKDFFKDIFGLSSPSEPANEKGGQQRSRKRRSPQDEDDEPSTFRPPPWETKFDGLRKRRSPQEESPPWETNLLVCDSEHERRLNEVINKSNCGEPKEVLVELKPKASYYKVVHSEVWVKRCVGLCDSDATRTKCVATRTRDENVPVRIYNTKTHKESCSTYKVEVHESCECCVSSAEDCVTRRMHNPRNSVKSQDAPARRDGGRALGSLLSSFTPRPLCAAVYRAPYKKVGLFCSLACTHCQGRSCSIIESPTVEDPFDSNEATCDTSLLTQLTCTQDEDEEEQEEEEQDEQEQDEQEQDEQEQDDQEEEFESYDSDD